MYGYISLNIEPFERILYSSYPAYLAYLAYPAYPAYPAYLAYPPQLPIFTVLKNQMKKVYFLLGSNMGDSTAQLGLARKKITQKIGKITRMSSLYKTAAWGNTQQPDFINQVIIVETHLSPETTLELALAIESIMGRTRLVKNEPRVIDIDILFFDKAIIQTANLIIPHPLIQDRNFVLTPLNELSPRFKHPVFKETVHALKQNCPDKLAVIKIS